MSENFGTGLAIFVAFLVLIAVSQWGCGNLASESDARQALVVQGFRDIKLIHRNVFFVSLQGCGKEDVARFDFDAINPTGARVNVSVCEGWPFKGATVRYP